MKVIHNKGQLNFVDALEAQAHNKSGQYGNYKTGALVVPKNKLPSFDVLVDSIDDRAAYRLVCLSSSEELILSEPGFVNVDEYVQNEEIGEIEVYNGQSTSEYGAPLTQIVSDGGSIYSDFPSGYYYISITDVGDDSVIYSNIFKIEKYSE